MPGSEVGDEAWGLVAFGRDSLYRGLLDVVAKRPSTLWERWRSVSRDEAEKEFARLLVRNVRDLDDEVFETESAKPDSCAH